MTTIREASYDLLRRLGITTFFGNPGSTEEPFLADFPDDFRYVLALQETSVVAIADGWAQAAARPALVNLHTAAGLGNAMGALLTAFQNRTPLVVTAGQQTREMLLLEPWLTNVQPELLPQPWVKWAYQPVRPTDVPAALMRAVATALQPPAGPVFVSLPLDDWVRPAGERAAVRSVAHRVAPDPARLAEFAARLAAAETPALVLGAEVARSDGWREAVRLAELLQAPVFAAPASERTPFPEDHPLYAGALPFARGPLASALEGHDLVLVVGAPVFRYYPWVAGPYLPDGCTLLHVTEDPAEAARAPVGDSLVGDAALALDAMSARVARRPRRPSPPAPRPQAVADPPDNNPMRARDVFAALRRAMPQRTVLVEESPSNLGDLHAAWPITEPDGFFTFASGGLGWGLPAAVGIALAQQDAASGRRVLAVVGDGSFQYSAQSLWTAVQRGVGLLVVVLRNDEYAILKSFAQLERTPGVPGLDLPGIDSAGIAAAYGCRTARVEHLGELQDALDDALAGEGPVVIEVSISQEVPPLL